MESALVIRGRGTKCHKPSWLKRTVNIYYISEFLCRSRIWVLLGALSLGFHEVQLPWASVLGFQGKSFIYTWQVGASWLGRGPASSLSPGASTGLYECPHDLVTDTPQRKWSIRASKQGGSCQMFYDLAWKSHTSTSSVRSWYTSVSYSLWGITTQRHKYQDAGFVGCHFGDFDYHRAIWKRDTWTHRLVWMGEGERLGGSVMRMIVVQHAWFVTDVKTAMLSVVSYCRPTASHSYAPRCLRDNHHLYSTQL